ncbi:MAG: 30S ribosomal protein S8e [Candidatus Thermoplasmatota archaeon]|jgi:small subunit ribosomal protein S8e|nr:30S ribosomal protein S8e [Candidatus Thermoplasmatota archaeon]
MTIFQGTAHKKITGGKLKSLRSKRRHELGREPTLTRIGSESRKTIRGMGGNLKAVSMRTASANVFIPAEKVTRKLTIQTVKENPANQHYVQRNIMTKGTIIQTESGLARVTSRPGQDGVVNAVLL